MLYRHFHDNEYITANCYGYCRDNSEQLLLDTKLKERLLKHKEWDKAAKYVDTVTADVLSEKPHSNPAQRWRRTLKAAQTSIDDLLILATTIPEEKRAEIFTVENAEKLVDGMLGTLLLQKIFDEKERILKEYRAKSKGEKDQKKKNELSNKCHEILAEMDKNTLLQPQYNVRTITMAASIANRCLDYCYKQYQEIEKDDTFQSLTCEVLEQAKNLCNSIVYKVEGQAGKPSIKSSKKKRF